MRTKFGSPSVIPIVIGSFPAKRVLCGKPFLGLPVHYLWFIHDVNYYDMTVSYCYGMLFNEYHGETSDQSGVKLEKKIHSFSKKG